MCGAISKLTVFEVIHRRIEKYVALPEVEQEFTSKLKKPSPTLHFTYFVKEQSLFEWPMKQTYTVIVKLMLINGKTTQPFSKLVYAENRLPRR